MTAPHADQIINGYMARLEAGLRPLPAARRQELMDDVRAHIAEARSQLTGETDADLLNIVDRLGDPSETAAEALRDLQPAATVASRTPLLEIAAIVLLLVFWPAGVVLLWMSDLWTRRDKLIGTLVPPGGFGGVFIFGLPALLLGTHASSGPVCMAEAGSDASGNVVITPTTCTGPLESVLHIALSVLLVVLLILVLISPILTAAYLGYRLRRRIGIGRSAPINLPPASGGEANFAGDHGAPA